MERLGKANEKSNQQQIVDTSRSRSKFSKVSEPLTSSIIKFTSDSADGRTVGDSSSKSRIRRLIAKSGEFPNYYDPFTCSPHTPIVQNQTFSDNVQSLTIKQFTTSLSPNVFEKLKSSTINANWPSPKDSAVVSHLM